MMKSSLRSFGIGVFLAGSIMAVNNHFIHQNVKVGSNISLASKDNAQKGTVSIKKSELDSLKTEATQAKEQLAKIQTDYNNLKNGHSSQKKNVKSYTLVITRGMGTTEVSKALKKGGIIKDDAEFELYMINKKKAKDIQIGEYKLTSDMKNDEILKAITDAN